MVPKAQKPVRQTIVDVCALRAIFITIMGGVSRSEVFRSLISFMGTAQITV